MKELCHKCVAKKAKTCNHRVESCGPGTMVKAACALDPRGANVKKGEKGVIFHERNFYRDNAGPIVRWFSGGCCNVYDGDVEVLLDWNS